MPVSVLDLVVLGVVLISALLAAVRGFTREVLAIVAWVTAAAAAWFLHKAALPYAEQYINNKTVALVAAIGGIFILTLIVVSVITVKISDLILDSRIGALDRTLGFVFGAGRGLLLCVIGWVFLSWLAQGKMPEWAANAKTGRCSRAPATRSSPCCPTTRRACSSSFASRSPRARRPVRTRPIRSAAAGRRIPPRRS